MAAERARVAASTEHTHVGISTWISTWVQCGAIEPNIIRGCSRAMEAGREGAAAPWTARESPAPQDGPRFGACVDHCVLGHVQL